MALAEGWGWKDCWRKGPAGVVRSRHPTGQTLLANQSAEPHLPGGGMRAAPRDLASLRLWPDAPILSSPTSQVNKLETDRMSIIRWRIKGSGMLCIPADASKESVVSRR